MMIPAAKAAADKEWDKMEKISAWSLTKVRSNEEVIDEARTNGAKKTACSMEGGRRGSARGQGRDVTRSCLAQTFLVNPAVLSRCRVLCYKMLEFVADCN